jgi:LEA14-like dessication related protein
MERPEVQQVSPRIRGVDFQGLDMAFDVDVNNPYPLPIKTPRFRYGIDIEGSRFFDSEAASQLNLPAMGVGTVTLPVRLSYVDMLRTYRNLADAPEAAYTLRGALIMPVLGRSFEVPVSHSGTVPILRPPTFSNIDVNLANISLLKTRINAEAAMKNPNAFALGIKNLGYALKLGGVELGGLKATTGSTLEAGQTGRLSLSGEISAASAIVNMIKGGNLGGAEIVPSGKIQTPYGPVPFNPGL